MTSFHQQITHSSWVFTRFRNYKSSTLTHTISDPNHMCKLPISLPMNRGVIFIHFQALTTKKSLTRWNPKAPKNQSLISLIQVLLPSIFCPEFFIGIIWSFLKHCHGLKRLATLIPVPPLLTSSFDLDKVIMSKITLQISYHSLRVVPLIKSLLLPWIYLFILSFNLTLKNWGSSSVWANSLCSKQIDCSDAERHERWMK